MFPTGSIARTWKVWTPSARPLLTCGVVQTVKAPPSRLHSNVLPASLAEKEKLEVAELLTLAGCAVIVVSGGVRSIVQSRLAGDASVVPAVSVARTRNVCGPSARAP